MSNKTTYTYTARHAEQPEKMVTFTLHDRWMSVSAGDPLAMVEQTLGAVTSDKAEAEDAGAEKEALTQPQLWLKPLAISLIERGTEPFRISDITVAADEGWLRVRGWARVGGLRLFPVTLINGPIDNPTAARAFEQKVAERQAEIGGTFFAILEYWWTWLIALDVLLLSFILWRRHSRSA